METISPIFLFSPSPSPPPTQDLFLNLYLIIIIIIIVVTVTTTTTTTIVRGTQNCCRSSFYACTFKWSGYGENDLGRKSRTLIWLLVTVKHCFEIVLGHRAGRGGSVSKDITTRGDTESSNMPSNPRNHQYLFPFQAVEITPFSRLSPALKCFTLQNQCRHRGGYPSSRHLSPSPNANGCCCSSRSLPVNRTIIENAFPISLSVRSRHAVGRCLSR